MCVWACPNFRTANPTGTAPGTAPCTPRLSKSSQVNLREDRSEDVSCPAANTTAAAALAVIILEGLHSHPTGSDRSWVRRAIRAATSSNKATKREGRGRRTESERAYSPLKTKRTPLSVRCHTTTSQAHSHRPSSACGCHHITPGPTGLRTLRRAPTLHRGARRTARPPGAYSP